MLKVWGAALAALSVLPAAAVAQDESTYDTWGGWTPDGASLVGYSYSFGDAELIEIDVETGHWTRLTDNDSNDWFPVVSPDNRYIAYVSDRGFEAFGGSEIYVRDRHSGEERAITADGSLKLGIAISPDGQRLVFPAPGIDGERDVWMVNMDGTGLVNLTQTDEFSETTPSFSADGQRIFFTRGLAGENASEDHAPLMSMDLHGGDVRVEIDLGGRIMAARQREDGVLLFSMRDRTGNRNLARFDPLSGEVDVLTHHEASDHAGFWSPDGSMISFSTYRWGDSEIYLMNADGSRQRNLTRTTQDAD